MDSTVLCGQAPRGDAADNPLTRLAPVCSGASLLLTRAG
jgi:hypothetical protein